jgi:hypothetical protein
MPFYKNLVSEAESSVVEASKTRDRAGWDQMLRWLYDDLL